MDPLERLNQARERDEALERALEAARRHERGLALAREQIARIERGDEVKARE